MEIVLGLDISTSIIGWSILSLDAKIGDYPIEKGHIDLRKVKGFWKKVDKVREELSQVLHTLQGRSLIINPDNWPDDPSWHIGRPIKKLFVEDPVKKFRRGMSSAGTIALLAKFNVMVSHFARDIIGVDPLYIDASAARKHIGMILLSKKKAGGFNQKEQTFRQLNETVFKDEDWPLNRNGKIQPYCYDAVDAYVICMAGVQGLGEAA